MKENNNKLFFNIDQFSINNVIRKKGYIVSKYWSPMLSGLDPYVPGEQPKDKKYIKLNTNENPYGPSPKVLEVIKNNSDEMLRLYPDPEFKEFRQTVADYYGISPEEVYAGNGSDELLAFAFLAFFKGKGPIIFPDITYSFYPVYCKIFDIEYKTIPLDDQFNIPVDRMKASNGGVVISNPNAPTGKVLSLDEIKIILENNKDSVVLVDEAYIDFGGQTTVALINQFDNLIVLQTLSKSRSLAGMRIGVALGQKELIDGICRVKNSINSYPLDRLALAAAVEAFKDESYFKETTNKVISTREWTVKAMRNLGFKVLESASNFIFATLEGTKAVDIFNLLRDKGILVRHFNKPRISEFLRISIGTNEEMEKLIEVLKEMNNA